jgi:hypothetical protein
MLYFMDLISQQIFNMEIMTHSIFRNRIFMHPGKGSQVQGSFWRITRFWWLHTYALLAIQRTIHRHIQENSTLHSHHREHLRILNIKSLWRGYFCEIPTDTKPLHIKRIRPLYFLSLLKDTWLPDYMTTSSNWLRRELKSRKTCFNFWIPFKNIFWPVSKRSTRHLLEEII